MQTMVKIITPIATKGVVASWVTMFILPVFDSIVDLLSMVNIVINTIILIIAVFFFLGVFSWVLIIAQQQNKIIIPDENEITTPHEGQIDEVGQ